MADQPAVVRDRVSVFALACAPRLERAETALVAPVPPLATGNVPEVILEAEWLWLADAAPMSLSTSAGVL